MRRIAYGLICAFFIAEPTANADVRKDICANESRSTSQKYSAPDNSTAFGIVDISVVKPKIDPDSEFEEGEESIDKVDDDAIVICVGGKKIGQAPHADTKIGIPAGKKSVDVKVELRTISGYYSSASKTVTVKPNDLAKVSFKLVPAKHRVSSLTTYIIDEDVGTVVAVIDSALRPDAFVRIYKTLNGDKDTKPKSPIKIEILSTENDAKNMGSIKIENLAAGNYDIEVVSKRCETKKPRSFTLGGGETWFFVAKTDCALDPRKILREGDNP